MATENLRYPVKSYWEKLKLIHEGNIRRIRLIRDGRLSSRSPLHRGTGSRRRNHGGTGTGRRQPSQLW
jgi:hypothetical protein